MPSTKKPNRWLAELDEVLDDCVERACVPAELAHCAICARYATDCLPFEALMSLFDVMPAEFRARGLPVAQERLGNVPAPFRRQQVDGTTLPVLLDSPGWPLVRSLVLQAPLDELAKHFADARLQTIEEITIVGYGYEGYHLDARALRALLESPRLTQVRSLILRSAELTNKERQHFWLSEFAARLQRINGVEYTGQAVRPLPLLREVAYFTERRISPKAPLPLFDPALTPALRRLAIDAISENAASVLRCLAAHEPYLDRLDELSVRLSGRDTARRALRSYTLPRSLRKLSFLPEGIGNWNQSIFEGEHYGVVVTDQKAIQRLEAGDRVTAYENAVIDWAFVGRLSKGLRELGLLLAPGLPVGELLTGLQRFSELERLTLVCPFSESALKELLGAAEIRRLKKLALVLTLAGPAQGETAFMRSKKKRYRDRLPPDVVINLALGRASADIEEFTAVAESFNLRRLGGRVDVAIKRLDALRALHGCRSRLPANTLCIDPTLDATAAKALAASDLLSRVYRLEVKVDDAAASSLAGCPGLRSVRALDIRGFGGSLSAFRSFVDSPHLRGTWELSLDADIAGADEALSQSALPESIVVLELSGDGLEPRDRASEVAHSGKLARLRRLGEGLELRVFSDARIATGWRESGATPTLMARFRKFVQDIYRVEGSTGDLPALKRKLLWKRLEKKEGVEVVRSLLATAFHGRAIAEGQAFASLDAVQQDVLTTIAACGGRGEDLNYFLHAVLTSYGLPVWDLKQLKNYIAGRNLRDDG